MIYRTTTLTEIKNNIDCQLFTYETHTALYNIGYDLLKPYENKKITKRELKKMNELLLKEYGLNSGLTKRLIDSAPAAEIYLSGDRAIKLYCIQKTGSADSATLSYNNPADLHQLSRWIEKNEQHIKELKQLKQDDETLKKYIDAINLIAGSKGAMNYILSDIINN